MTRFVSFGDLDVVVFDEFRDDCKFYDGSHPSFSAVWKSALEQGKGFVRGCHGAL